MRAINIIGCILSLLTGCIGATVFKPTPVPLFTSTNLANVSLTPTRLQSLTATFTKNHPTLTLENTPSTFYPAGNGDLIAFDSEVIQVVSETTEGQKVLNLTDGFISLVNVRSGSVVRLTSTGDISRRAAWSPDGRLIAYNIAVYADNELFAVMYSNGINLLASGDCLIPVWSPDGTALACSSDPPQMWSGISGVNFKNKVIKRITDKKLFGTVSWSPDGQKLAYSAYVEQEKCCGSVPEVINIFVQSLQRDEKPEQLTSAQSYDSYPEWSPDGKYILFTSNRTGMEQIYIMNADGLHEYALTTDNKPNFDPKWSPDGTKIVFVSLRNEKDISKCSDHYLRTRLCNTEIYVMNADGSKQTRITNHLTADYEPVWSPDGTRIAFVSMRDELNYKNCELNCNSEIYVVGIDPKKVTRLTNNQTNDSDPVWQPKP